MKNTILPAMALLVLVLASCGGSDSSFQVTEIQIPAEAGSLVDGSYRAAYSHLDSHGWAPFLSITVNNGNIAAADFDYINGNGQRKSADAAYQERMSGITGMGPAQFTPEIEARLVNAQGPDFDAVTGATSSSVWAQGLANVLLERARSGETQDLVLPMNETYRASVGPDSRGWSQTLSITYSDGSISEVSYDEVQMENGQVTASKAGADYSSHWQSGPFETSAGEIYEILEAALVATGDYNQVDTVTGATSTSTAFEYLAETIMEEQRISAPSPW